MSASRSEADRVSDLKQSEGDSSLALRYGCESPRRLLRAVAVLGRDVAPDHLERTQGTVDLILSSHFLRHGQSVAGMTS